MLLPYGPLEYHRPVREEESMTPYEAIDARFSCRSYADRPLETATLDELTSLAATLSQEGNLRFVLVGPKSGGGDLKLAPRMFSGTVSSYLALIGPDDNSCRGHP